MKHAHSRKRMTNNDNKNKNKKTSLILPTTLVFFPTQQPLLK